tara:strand:- start:523 stop:870 length:348 start_codon:yes stop_codon:yes gene_type:complete
MIPEAIVAAKYLGFLGGGWAARLLLVKYLGKTKEEAEVVLNWEEIHAARDLKLLAEISRLESKIDEFIEQMELERAIHKKEITRWEQSDRKKGKIIKDQIKLIAEQETELETYRK